MALSKKHYEQFAYNFKQQLDRNTARHADGLIHSTAKSAVHGALNELATNMAVSFALDNPRFDRERFLKACGF